MAIKCCNGCVPPKRTPYCHCKGNCPEWEAEKEKHDAEKDAADKKKSIECGLTSQVFKRVDRAEKTRRKTKGW